MSAAVSIRRLDVIGDRELRGLSDVLIDCVEGGASISFMLPFPRQRAVDFWREVSFQVEEGLRRVLIAEDDCGICGTVQLNCDLPENQPHRADLCKLLVHSRARRRGVGEALMRAAETAAREAGWQQVSLGPRVLRVETAAVALAAIVSQ